MIGFADNKPEDKDKDGDEVFPREWEEVNETTFRLKVAGGYMVKVIEKEYMPSEVGKGHYKVTAMELGFVPDDTERWKLEPK
jgi:hypothetical protein